MNLKDKLNEKRSYYAKVAFARYLGQGENFKKGVAAANRDDYQGMGLINGSARRPGPLLPITAIVRLKNAQTTLMVAVESIATYCKEIILIDNQSTDLSREMIRELIKKYPDRMKSYTYETPLSRPGNGYLDRVRAGEGSHAEYCNYSFSLGSEEYLLKWDSDNLALPTFYTHIGHGIARGFDRIYFDGVDLLGVFSCTNEGSVYKRSLDRKYVEGDFCEILTFGEKDISKYTAPAPVFIHLKQLV